MHALEPKPLPIQFQTIYAELLERTAVAQLDRDFPLTGTFFTQSRNDRLYWYFREPAPPLDTEGREIPTRLTRYVGPDSDELRRRIEAHKERRDSARERREMVQALVEGARMPAPDRLSGRILEVLADAGLFRLRGVLVGTVAFQTYAGLLGMKPPAAVSMTADLDIAQFKTISVAVGDSIGGTMGEALRKVDPKFRERHTIDGRPGSSFLLGDRYRVDVLTPNEGPDNERPVALPALGAVAQPLRFLDFLIYREVQAVVLHGSGILVNVPRPERYALHKLLVSRLRIDTKDSQAKSRKDLTQAAFLLPMLAFDRPQELSDAWGELRARGPRWRQLADDALAQLPDDVLDGGFGRRRVRDVLVSEEKASAPKKKAGTPEP